MTHISSPIFSKSGVGKALNLICSKIQSFSIYIPVKLKKPVICAQKYDNRDVPFIGVRKYKDFTNL